MHIDALEQRWMWIVGVIVVVMLGSIFYAAFALSAHPPSNVETVDSTRLHLTEEFAEDNLGLVRNADGSVTVTMVAMRYGIFPRNLEIPVDTPVTFRIATPDVLHGLHIPESNMDTMVIPGFVSQITTTFSKTGEFPMFCNEYCGLGHHYMWSRINIVAKSGG